MARHTVHHIYIFDFKEPQYTTRNLKILNHKNYHGVKLCHKLNNN